MRALLNELNALGVVTCEVGIAVTTRVMMCICNACDTACRIVLDDFREAYYWLRHNTPPDAKVMSW